MKAGTGKLTRRATVGMIGAALASPRQALAGSLETMEGSAFGTHWRISARRDSGVAALRSGMEELFSDVDLQFSPWRPDSAISRFNLGSAGQSDVAPSLVAVTDTALDIARRSDGAFDPTVGPLVARWGFGPIRRGSAPDWRGISVADGRIAKAWDDLTLDLCGIAKGWALDRAVAHARDRGWGDLLFEIGGEFVALGQHPLGRDWRIGVESPLVGWPAPAALRLPSGMAAATSGMRAQGYELNGTLYGHIIDPRTWFPVAGALRSVTVVAGDATTADGWATALFAAGEKAGPEIARSEHIAALFLFEADGAYRHVHTGLMQDLIL